MLISFSVTIKITFASFDLFAFSIAFLIDPSPLSFELETTKECARAELAIKIKKQINIFFLKLFFINLTS